MQLPELKLEFQTKYNMSSKGAPDLDNYEMSVFLTQSVRDIVDEIYKNFEHTEYIKKGLGPLIKEEVLTPSKSEDYFSSEGLDAYDCELPTDLWYTLQENVKLKGLYNHVEVVAEDLDNINKTVMNPFRKPNSRKILRTEIGANKVRLYSGLKITKYKVKYLKQYTPIILTDFTTDPDLMGDETIDGKNKPSMTELPAFLHARIVDRAVILAIKALRQNNLQTQIEV
jgi:hypothetical protein